jgi:hypothetical protein
MISTHIHNQNTHGELPPSVRPQSKKPIASDSLHINCGGRDQTPSDFVMSNFDHLR